MGHSLSHIDLFLNKLSLIFRNYSRALISTYNNTPLSCTYNVVNFFYEQAAKLTLLAAFSKKIAVTYCKISDQQPDNLLQLNFYKCFPCNLVKGYRAYT